MTQFSANLGFLWTELSLPQAIHAAHASGFDAVECHWPYEVDPAMVQTALRETGLKMLGINTLRGDHLSGDNGLSALPDRIQAARSAIDQAISYATAINCPNIHVMAGFAKGALAHQTLVGNLRYACERAAKNGITILIEPLNHYDAPGYFLQTTGQAVEIISEVGMSNLKLMFDCYHVQLMEGDLSNKISTLLPQIGHIQFASVPSRGQPGIGEVSYAHIFQHIKTLGYHAPLGAEYKPTKKTDDTLGWMQTLTK